MQHHETGRGLKHLISAFGWSMAGFRAAIRYEAAFRQELAMCAVLVPAALWFGQSAVERALLLASVLIVLVAELVNSAVEAAVDRVSMDHHPLSERAKDLGSAAVFTALTNVGVVWLVVLWPRFGA